MRIWKEFSFEAAHYLPNVPTDHPCRAMHGHSYQLRVTIDGECEPTLGWVLDYAMLKAVVSPSLVALDHTLLNEINGLDNPTCERIAKWLWARIEIGLPASVRLVEVALQETPSAGVSYTGT